MRFEGIVRFEWRDVCVIELNRSLAEGSIGIATLAVEPLAWSKRGHDFVRIVVCYQACFDIRLFGRVSCTNCIGSGFGSLKRFGHSECDVLAVVTNHIIFEWRPAFFAHTRESRPRNRAKDLADISAMKDRLHAGHLLSRRRIEPRDL